MTNHCTFDQSQALKDIGFDMPVKDYIYTGDTGNNINRYFHTLKADNHNADPLCISQPTPYEVLQWAREKHGIDAWVQVKLNDDTGTKRYVYYIFQSMYYGQSAGTYPTHPEAEIALVWKIIEIIKEKKA